MGKTDEHWCNSCKRSLDKSKDKYVEFELVNNPSIIKDKKKPKKPKGIICQQCIDKDPQLKNALELMVKTGNPNFNVNITCLSKDECENYEQSKHSGINCSHIATLGDKVYCKRSHPGVLHLPQEKAEVERLNRTLATEWIRNLIKNPRLKKLINTTHFEQLLETTYTPPSSIIEDQHENLPKQP